MFDFYRFAAAVPETRIADISFQLQEMKRLYALAEAKCCALVLFPRLTLTGNSCGELFYHDTLLDAAFSAARDFAAVTKKTIAVFGLPLAVDGRLCAVTAVAQAGHILGFVPGAADSRFFSSFPENRGDVRGIPAGNHILFSGNFTFACGKTDPFALPDAELLLLPGNEPELPGRSDMRKTILRAISSARVCAVVTAHAGWGESTAETVPCGHALIAENGTIRAELPPLQRKSAMIFADLDMGALRFRRRRKPAETSPAAPERTIAFAAVPELADDGFASLEKHPFLPADPAEHTAFCEDTLAIQAAGAARRMECCRCEKAVLGISGGLDSTLALLVLRRACCLLGWQNDHILAVTMPGFGTTGRTKNNALKLAESLGCTIREISIAAACRQHFADLQHDESVHNSTYENSQARERTQILMDLANEVNGIVIGTGDLSELALGWCTYNGDQMSMYAVNGSIPKSVIPALMKHEAEILPRTAAILHDVIDTPVSPELLPAAENGEPGQKTEAILGAYELHDFFLYHALVNGSGPDKIFAMAKSVFAGCYEEKEIRRCLALFFRRFFTQQFKRSASPDGAQAGPLSFSPRSGFLMPSDVSGELYNMICREK